MPLKIVKNKETGKNEVLLVVQPTPIGTNVPARPMLSMEIDYDMHRWQNVLVPAQSTRPRKRA